jgi:hypothetical protein
MPVEQAALCIATGASIAPHAMGGNSAALLTQVCFPHATCLMSCPVLKIVQRVHTTEIRM